MSLVENQAGALSSLCTTSPSFGPGPRVWAQACHISRNYWDQTSGSALSPKILFIKIFGSGMAISLTSFYLLLNHWVWIPQAGMEIVCEIYFLASVIKSFRFYCAENVGVISSDLIFRTYFISGTSTRPAPKLAPDWSNRWWPGTTKTVRTSPKVVRKCLAARSASTRWVTSPTIDWVVYDS